MIGNVSGPAEDNREAVAMGFFGKIFLGHSGVSLQPFFGCPVPQVLGDLIVNGRPGVPELVGGRHRSSAVVGGGDKGFVEVRVLPLASSKEGYHPVMHGGQVAKEVDDAIFTRGNGLKEFLVGQIAEVGTGLAEGLFPTE